MVMEAIHSLSIVERLQLADSRLKRLHCRWFEGTGTSDACMWFSFGNCNAVYFRGLQRSRDMLQHNLDSGRSPYLVTDGWMTHDNKDESHSMMLLVLPALVPGAFSSHHGRSGTGGSRSVLLTRERLSVAWVSAVRGEREVGTSDIRIHVLDITLSTNLSKYCLITPFVNTCSPCHNHIYSSRSEDN